MNSFYLVGSVFIFSAALGTHSAVSQAMINEGPKIYTGEKLGLTGDLKRGSREFLNRVLRQEAKAGRISQIEALIREGADVNGTAEFGETALYYAVMFGRIKTVSRLLQLGANPDCMDESNRTPLLKAAENCNYLVVDALLKAGAHVNHTDFAGRTALINAAEADCVHAVASILRRRKGHVDIEAQDASFHTARDYTRHPWIEQMLDLAEGKNGEKSSDFPMALLP